MATKTTELPDLSTLTIFGYQLIMPFDDAVLLLKAIAKAEVLESEYISNGNYKHWVSKKLPGTISMAPLSAAAYTEGIINGPRNP